MSDQGKIEINQDQEFDADRGEVLGPLDVYWAYGHGHNVGEFIRAVVDHCLEWSGEVPAIRAEDAPQELWQRSVEHGGAVEYQRRSEPPIRHEWNPITILDLERGSHGGTKCSVDGCSEPWASGPSARVRVDAAEDHVAVRLWLCREHQRRFPEPSYRVCMIPVGATILLPSEGDQDNTAVEFPEVSP